MDDYLISPEAWKVNAQAENALIGCLLVDAENTLRLIRGVVSAADFVTDAGKAAYMAAVSLIDSGKPCDPVLIQAEAAKLGTPLNDDFCREAMMMPVPIGNAAATAGIIHEAAQDRAGREIGNALMQGEATPLEALSRLQELLTEKRNRTHTPLEAADALTNYILDAAEGKKRPFLSTGYKSLDEMLSGGIVTSGLFTLAARPGTGKTTAGINIANHVAAAGGTVLYVSLEMDEIQINTRRAACLSGLSYSNIYGGKIRDSDREWQRLMESINTLSKMPVIIRDTPATIEEIEQAARCTEGLSLLVVDHIGLIRQQAGKKTFSRYEFMTDTAHRLKQLALSMRLPILALCQLNRGSEQRNDKRPGMADLRDSGAIEEDSDVVCLLHREAMYLSEEHRPKPWEQQPIDFIVAKNRHGLTGTVTLDFYGINARIMERESFR